MIWNKHHCVMESHIYRYSYNTEPLLYRNYYYANIPNSPHIAGAYDMLKACYKGIFSEIS